MLHLLSKSPPILRISTFHVLGVPSAATPASSPAAGSLETISIEPSGLVTTASRSSRRAAGDSTISELERPSQVPGVGEGKARSPLTPKRHLLQADDIGNGIASADTDEDELIQLPGAAPRHDTALLVAGKRIRRIRHTETGPQQAQAPTRLAINGPAAAGCTDCCHQSDKVNISKQL